MELKSQKQEIIDLYGQKKSIRAIAKILGCSYSGVKRLLHVENVSMRNKCESLNLCPDNFTISEFDIVLGTILGDGHLTKPKTSGESQLTVGHSIKQQLYVNFKHQVLSRWIGCNVYSLFHTLSNKKTYETVNFLTRKSPKFTELRELFYDKDFNKIAPINFIEERLNPVSLAIWYMDDGYNSPYRGCEICSESFTEEENNLLAIMLNKKFNLKFSTRRVKSKNYRLTLKTNDKSSFFEIIKPYILPHFQYKIESSETIRQTR